MEGIEEQIDMILDAIKKYKELGEYYCSEYGRSNEVLDDFKSRNPTLNKAQTLQLKEILDAASQYEKVFVADLLYLYNDFDEELLEPMVTTAIRYRDPSFNRVFVNPCLSRFGYKKVIDVIKSRFVIGDITDRIGVSNLLYWLRPDDRTALDELIAEIKSRSKKSDNVIELYHFHLAVKDIAAPFDIPANAEGLMKIISGNPSWEDLLYNKLGWNKTGSSPTHGESHPGDQKRL